MRSIQLKLRRKDYSIDYRLFINDVSDEFKEWLKKNQKPNTVKINIKRTADRLIDLLTAHNLSDKDLGKINFEFILVKADLGYLGKVNNANEEALKGFMYSDMGLEPLIQTVETKFKNIGYSVYSANKKYSGYPYITTNLIERITTELGIAPLEKQLRNLDLFVDKVEADAESYTDEDWESLNSEFEAMISEIEENSENMTEEEKEQALNAIGKYYGICAKKGMETVVEGGKKAMDSLIPFLKGFSDAFKDLDDSSDSK